MIDACAIEPRAIRLVFLGLNAGEQEIARLHCFVYSSRTLLQRLGSDVTKPVY